MNKVLGAYTNGNYKVVLFEDGTKIRHNDIEPAPGQSPDECFIADFPESMDVTITNRCNAGCEMCYAGCTANGVNADIMNAEWVNHLHPYTEMAIGGGNVFEHPDLVPFLEKLKKQNVIANITVNQKHFIQYFDCIQDLIERGLIKGVGVSVFNPTLELLDLMAATPNVVAHCILGVTPLKTLKQMYDEDIRLLLLGYKTTGRGEAYEARHSADIEANIAEVNDALEDIAKHFKVLSFDNKALKQLDVRCLLTDEEWNRFYMGDDGIDGKTTSATMFIDMVGNFYAVNSMEKTHYPISENATPESMFKSLQRRSS